MAPNYAIFRINSLLTLILACPANLVLIWLILCKPSRALQLWSRVLLQSAIIDLALVIGAFIFQSPPVSEGATVYWVLLGPLAHIQNRIVQYAACYFHTVFLMEFAKYAVAVQFVYRWLVICREREISIRQYYLCLCIPALCALIFTALFLHAAQRPAGNSVINPTDQSELYLLAYILQDGILDNLHILWTIMATTATIIIVIMCNFLIWRKSRQTGALQQADQKTQEIRRQVGRVLLIQAIIPLALQTIPVIFICMSIFMEQQFSMLSTFLLTQTWTTCIYPLATMSIVGHYRRQIKKLALWWKNNLTIYPSTP